MNKGICYILTKYRKSAILHSYPMNRYMKIALIGSKGIPTRSGGVERHVEDLAVRFARLGHDVTVYGRKSYGLPEKSEYNGVRVLAMPSIATKNLDAITATLLGTLHIILSRYDIVHYHGIGPSSLLLLIRIFRPKMKVISTFHSRDYEHKKWGWFAQQYFYFGEWVSCRFPHRTLAISHSLVDYARKAYKRKAIYIPNGCAVTPIASTNILHDLGLESKKYILTVSRLVRHKGIHFLIEAFEKLQASNSKYNDYKLVIVGGSSHTDDYVSEIQELARKNKNIVVAGEQSGRNLKELFSHAYLFAQPSLFEGLSIALLEAMGYGLAPFVSDIPENREAVGEAGITFQSGNVKDLQRNLQKLLDEPEDVLWKGILAQRRAKKEYHWDTIASQTLAVYETLLKENSSSYQSERRTFSHNHSLS